jgi:hypothetical protein
MSSKARGTKRALGWRAMILAHFTPEIAETGRLTIVTDPDHLLAEQVILGELHERGFELVLFDDHVAFRFAYESRYQKAWERGEKTHLIVVLQSTSANFDALPYDLLEQARFQGRCLSFSVGELFPKLSPNVVITLDRGCFDVLHAAHTQADATRIGIDATRDFALRHVFRVAPELIRTPASLLRVLLQRHYRRISFPAGLDERFIHLLKTDRRWEDWPLADIVPHRASFLAFIEERWPHFIRASLAANGSQVPEPPGTYGLRISGPVELPFGHDDVKVYIDSLFQEGQLRPAEGFTADQLPHPWMRVGVADVGGTIRFERLMRRLKEEIPAAEASHREWVGFAQGWAEWAALRWELEGGGGQVESVACEALHDQIEARFAPWMQRNYASLHSLSTFHRPVMVHHIPQHMAHAFTATGSQEGGSGPPSRHALVVVDGLALDQWVVLRDILQAQVDTDMALTEDGAFAWVPTLTGVSRQAIFAGTEPLYFESSLGSTSKEKSQWTRFWEGQGAKRIEIGYVREGSDQEDDDFLEEVFIAAEHPKMRMLGVVVGKIDQSMHGVKTGSGGLHALVRQWAHSGAMHKLVRGLLDLGYGIIVTADHGNIHGRGIGKPNVGVVADERGERAHVFADENTRANVTKEYPEAVVWPQIGLPDSWRVLLAPGRSAFVPQGKHTVGHGGIAMEEVIVPFVKISGPRDE